MAAPCTRQPHRRKAQEQRLHLVETPGPPEPEYRVVFIPSPPAGAWNARMKFKAAVAGTADQLAYFGPAMAAAGNDQTIRRGIEERRTRHRPIVDDAAIIDPGDQLGQRKLPRQIR